MGGHVRPSLRLTPDVPGEKTARCKSQHAPENVWLILKLISKTLLMDLIRSRCTPSKSKVLETRTASYSLALWEFTVFTAGQVVSEVNWLHRGAESVLPVSLQSERASRARCLFWTGRPGPPLSLWADCLPCLTLCRGLCPTDAPLTSPGLVSRVYSALFPSSVQHIPNWWEPQRSKIYFSLRRSFYH